MVAEAEVAEEEVAEAEVVVVAAEAGVVVVAAAEVAPHSQSPASAITLGELTVPAHRVLAEVGVDADAAAAHANQRRPSLQEATSSAPPVSGTVFR